MQNKAESTASNTDSNGGGGPGTEEDPFSMGDGNDDIFMSPP